MIKKIYILLIVLFLSLLFCGSEDLSSIYDKKPDIKNSFEGVLKESEKIKVLNYLNYIRSLHGLKTVAYNKKADIFTAKASLIMAANNTLTHAPAENMKCWSKDGAIGAKASNLGIYYFTDISSLPKSSSFIELWLIDKNVETLGHRRWLLDPFLKNISFGRVDGRPLVPSQYFASAAALYVINTEANDITEMKNNFVAYPYGNYPAELFDPSWYMSFSVIPNKKNTRLNNKVDFKNASIEITDDNKFKIMTTGKGQDNAGFGLNNVLIWKATGLKKNQNYKVTIKNVIVNNETLTFSYSFSLKKN